MPHIHRPVGRDDYIRPDGKREVWWKCGCGLEEKRQFEGGRLTAVRYRWNGRWADAVEWLSLTVPLALCPDCNGDGCPTCDGVGVAEETGEKIRPPVPVGR